ncbi:hypothetical protein KAU40_02475 [Candidatus Parcubacteria bacterium]|nr:hypothetical protein [Candidatus Parcubacteria bacterium]
MAETKNTKYTFQKKKLNFTKRLFEKGLNAASYILFALKDFPKDLHENFYDVFLAELPNSYPGFKLMKVMFGYDSKKKMGFKKHTIQVNISRLKKQGLIIEDEGSKFRLTAKGEEMIAYIKDRHSILEKPWDNKIRVVVFDIPEKKKHFREWLRTEIGLLLFKPLQKSVYIGKYPIPDDLYQEIIRNGFFNDIHIFTINEADKQKELLELLEGD